MTFHPSSNNDLDMSPSSIPVPPAFAQRHTSPIRFATTTNAFGLNTSPSSSTSPVREYHLNGPADIPPPTAGTVTTRRLRRPSMLSLAQNAESSEEVTPLRGVMVQDPSSSKAPYHQPQPRWGPATFLVHEAIPRHSSAPPPLIKGLSTSTPPIPLSDPMDEGSGSHSPVEMDGIDGPLRWMPNHLPSSSRRKGKARMSDALSSGGSTLPTSLHAPPFTGRPLPAPLLATLISESSPLEHEMRSEARLQRLLTSHPQALPLTPRAPRSSRGRFPEMVGGDDDDDDDPGMCRPSWARMSSWMNRASSSDSDSDEMVTEDPPEPVNSAFASGMDMDRHMPDIDRPTSSSSSCIFGESGKSTPGQSRSNSGSAIPCPTPPQQSAPWPKAMRMSFGSAGAGMVPSPGGLGLPSAFGGLGMGGISTPSGSPTIERLEVGL